VVQLTNTAHVETEPFPNQPNSVYARLACVCVYIYIYIYSTDLNEQMMVSAVLTVEMRKRTGDHRSLHQPLGAGDVWTDRQTGTGGSTRGS